MKKQNIVALLVIVASFVFISCKKDELVKPTEPIVVKPVEFNLTISKTDGGIFVESKNAD